MTATSLQHLDHLVAGQAAGGSGPDAEDVVARSQAPVLIGQERERKMRANQRSFCSVTAVTCSSSCLPSCVLALSLARSLSFTPVGQARAHRSHAESSSFVSTLFSTVSHLSMSRSVLLKFPPLLFAVVKVSGLIPTLTCVALGSSLSTPFLRQTTDGILRPCLVGPVRCSL